MFDDDILTSDTSLEMEVRREQIGQLETNTFS